MTMWWQAFAAAVAKKQAEEAAAKMKAKVTPPIPFACIRRSPQGSEALCGHGITVDEFAFLDAGYAVEFYSDCRFLSVCGDCVDAARSKGLVRGSPSATGQIGTIYK